LDAGKANTPTEREGLTRRLIVLLVVAAMAVAVLAIPAAAGEVKGPPGDAGAEGGATPVAGFWFGEGAASICSFSGLNDVIVTDPESPDFEPTMTQSYGRFLSAIMLMFEVSVQEAKAILEESPDHSCNPTKGPNPKGVGR
jgi:hypothetical protein